MISPKDVLERNRNIKPYVAQIDEALRAPWTEEMKSKGRRVSLRIPKPLADAAGVLEVPSDEQAAALDHGYRAAGWVFKPDTKSETLVWVFEYPKGKKP
jgi:hypothetical protein